MITIQELTTQQDRSGGFRNLLITREDNGSLCITSICAVRRENIAFTGDEPLFFATGNIESNIDLARLLADLAKELLAHPHSVALPICAPSPVMQCAEG